MVIKSYPEERRKYKAIRYQKGDKIYAATWIHNFDMYQVYMRFPLDNNDTST